MAPLILGSTLVSEAANVASDILNKKQSQFIEPSLDAKKQTKYYKWDVVWFNVLVFGYLYTGAIYGMYLFFTSISIYTVLWSIYLTVIGTLGATAGAHRLWTHRTYKAKLPLRVLLAYFQATCFQNHIYEWVRDHRVHHKFTDTDADPHNASRGFFFSHVGWLMVRKHKDVIEKGKTVYVKDLEEDEVVMFQKKYFGIIMPLCCFILPTFVPWYFWGENLSNAWYTASIFRYMINVNGTWLVNSAAHIYGTRPYDKNILPRENTFVGYIGMGEGWHNYHHTFPWDYRASEFKGYWANLTTGFIEIMAKISWAYDLKTVPFEMVKKRILRTGDGTIKHNEDKLSNVDKNVEDDMRIWGWGDKDMPTEDVELIKKFNNIKG